MRGTANHCWRMVTLGLMAGCGEAPPEANQIASGVYFRGELIAPDGLFATTTSTTYSMGGRIIPEGVDPLATACSTPFGDPYYEWPSPPRVYEGRAIAYEHATAREVIMVSPRSYRQLSWDLNQGRPPLLPGEFWGVGPIVETIPCGAPIQGVCYRGGHFEVPITLELFPGCP